MFYSGHGIDIEPDSSALPPRATGTIQMQLTTNQFAYSFCIWTEHFNFYFILFYWVTNHNLIESPIMIELNLIWCDFFHLQTADVQRLDLTDCNLYGVSPSNPGPMVLCDMCNHVIAPEGITRHVIRVHGSKIVPTPANKIRIPLKGSSTAGPTLSNLNIPNVNRLTNNSLSTPQATEAALSTEFSNRLNVSKMAPPTQINSTAGTKGVDKTLHRISIVQHRYYLSICYWILFWTYTSYKLCKFIHCYSILMRTSISLFLWYQPYCMVPSFLHIHCAHRPEMNVSHMLNWWLFLMAHNFVTLV